MDISTKLDALHHQAKRNVWLKRFSIFCRVGLAWGFFGAGITKIMGQRFTSLSDNHPMGHYLTALHLTGFYYPFIGYVQVLAALLLLIPRTATLGAVLYFPVILNICILSISVRFEGSLISSTLMVLANLYVLCWNYDKLKLIFPFNRPAPIPANEMTRKFPTRFFIGVVATVALVIFTLTHIFSIEPRNTLSDCNTQCQTSQNPGACNNFCNCIHKDGKPLSQCLEEYQKALKQTAKAK
jgi:uncharacterized membrane protein YphA (DoxX/SURF4 family)